MGFRDEVRQFAIDVESADRAIVLEVGALALESIVEGSPSTGSPGQPVDTGALKASWHQEITEDGVAISTNIAYAPIIEDGLRSSYDPSGDTPPRSRTRGGVRKHIKSTVGGHQSVALTIASADRLIEEAGRRVGGVVE